MPKTIPSALSLDCFQISDPDRNLFWPSAREVGRKVGGTTPACQLACVAVRSVRTTSFPVSCLLLSSFAAYSLPGSEPFSSTSRAQQTACRRLTVTQTSALRSSSDFRVSSRRPTTLPLPLLSRCVSAQAGSCLCQAAEPRSASQSGIAFDPNASAFAPQSYLQATQEEDEGATDGVLVKDPPLRSDLFVILGGMWIGTFLAALVSPITSLPPSAGMRQGVLHFVGLRGEKGEWLRRRRGQNIDRAFG